MKNFTRVWWLLLLRGALAVLFGLIAFFWPLATLTALAYAFGVYALTDGLTAVWMAGHAPQQRSLLRSLMVRGLLGIGVGLLALYDPKFAINLFYYLVAVWALFSGLFEIVAAGDIYRDTPGEWSMALMGITSLLCGLWMVVSPTQSKEMLAWVVGGYVSLYGLLMILFAFRLRSRHHPAHPLPNLGPRPL